MPTDDYPVKLTGPETHRLADMAGVHMDLRTVAATAKVLDRKRGSDSIRDNFLELEALQSHALTRYGRSFNSGVRTAFIIPPEWITNLPAELCEAHSEFLALRDKHIAHSVNDWELNVPVARVRIDRNTGEGIVHQVTVTQSRVVMLASDSLDKLWRVAKALADRVEMEMNVESKKLLEIAKQIPLEELKRRIKEDPPDVPGRRDIRNARGRT
jgi:hypothetical protein